MSVNVSVSVYECVNVGVRECVECRPVTLRRRAVPTAHG